MFLPQPNTAADFETANECEPPHMMKAIGIPSSVLTNVSFGTFSVMVPIPSWPYELEPHVYRSPLFVKVSEWYCPHVI